MIKLFFSSAGLATSNKKVEVPTEEPYLDTAPKIYSPGFRFLGICIVLTKDACVSTVMLSVSVIIVFPTVSLIKYSISRLVKPVFFRLKRVICAFK